MLHEKGKTMTAPKPRPRQSKQLDAGGFHAEISSFRLYLAAEGKAGKTVRTYTEAVQWFAAAHLRRETGLTSWEQVGKQDIQRWIVRLLDRYSAAYASNQDRALQQFFKWLAVEEVLPVVQGERGGVIAGERVRDVNGPARRSRAGPGVQGVAGMLSLSL